MAKKKSAKKESVAATEFLAVRLPAQLKRRAQVEAERRGQSTSAYVRYVLEAYYDFLASRDKAA